MPKIPQNVKKWVRKEKTQDLENKTRLTAKIKRKKQDEYVQGAKRLLNFFIIIYCVY